MKHTTESKLHKIKTTYEEQQDNTCELTLTIESNLNLHHKNQWQIMKASKPIL